MHPLRRALKRDDTRSKWRLIYVCCLDPGNHRSYYTPDKATGKIGINPVGGVYVKSWYFSTDTLKWLDPPQGVEYPWQNQR